MINRKDFCRLFFLKVIFLITFVGLLYLPPLPLNALDPETPINRYQLDEWTERSGFPGHSVYNVVQASDGFLWVEDSDGTLRFDGQKFTPIHRLGAAGTAIDSQDYANILMAEDNGTLWLRKNSRRIFLYEEGKFKPITTEKPFPYDIWVAQKDSYGNVWLGTSRNLYCYQKGQILEYGLEKGLPGKGISSILEDRCGCLWVSTYHGGLFKLKEGRFSPIPVNGIDETTSVNWLYEDRSGIIWIGTNNGLFLKKGKKPTHLTTVNGLSHNAVTDIIEDRDGNIWVGTKSGINRIRKNAGAPVRIDTRLPGQCINVIFEDMEKNLWIGTEGEGLKRFRDAAFYTIDFGKDSVNCVTALHQTDKGDTWIGNLLGDLMRIENEKIVETFHFNNEIISLEDDRGDNLWVGTSGMGLYRLTPGRRLFHYGNNVKSNEITSLYCDSRNRLWIGTVNGFFVHENGSFKSYRGQKGFPAGFIYFFREDDRQNIWIGSSGLYRLEKGALDPNRITNALDKVEMKCCVSFLFFDDDDSMWLGTPCGIIIRKKDRDYTVFRDKILWRSSQNAAINHIFKDEAGFFWMNSVDGISRINRKAFDDLAQGKIKTIVPREYGPGDGLKCGECAALPYYSVISPKKGEYWFGTKKGVAVLRPEKVKINKVAPRVVIEKMRVEGKDVPLVKPEYRFENAGHIRFYFTAATYACQGGVCFKYKLAGYDDEWLMLTPGKERSAEYWNLPAGSYTFSVMACNNDHVWSSTPAIADFVIPSVFMGSMFWAILIPLSGLMLFGLFYRFYRISPRRVKSDVPQPVSEVNKDTRHLVELKELMEEKKVYRAEGLSLRTLSRQLSIPDRQLSQLINDKLNKTFFDLVNYYRVEEAKQMLLEEEEEKRNILDIAFEVGFNTKSAFNRAFKKHTNMAPSQFRETFSNSKK